MIEIAKNHKKNKKKLINTNFTIKTNRLIQKDNKLSKAQRIMEMDIRKSIKSSLVFKILRSWLKYSKLFPQINRTNSLEYYVS